MNAQQVWQSQALDAPRVTLAFVQHRIDDLRRRIQIRNALEYVGAMVAMVLVLSTWTFFRTRPLTFAAVVLWLVATLHFMVRRYRHASAQTPAEQLGTTDALRFYRQQLVRQREAGQGFWRRLLLPTAPAVLLTVIALIVEVHPTPWTKIAAFGAWVVFGTIIGARNNARVVRRYQQEIDALDSMNARS